MSELPAWSDALAADRLQPVPVLRLNEPLTRRQAWGDGRGAGVRVAILDSGVDATHPWVGPVQGGVVIEPDETAAEGVWMVPGPHEDLYGHGTACAAIIRKVAPDCEIYSVRVLGSALTGRGSVFAAGVRWCLEQGMDVVNLSLSTRNLGYAGVFHELVDRAAFENVMLVSAINNLKVDSIPAQFAGVFSVAATADHDHEHWVVNPSPPVEFGAPGVDLEIAWHGGGSIVGTGNSFAAPHIAGLAARILGEHPGISAAEVKMVLRALADNSQVGRSSGPTHRASGVG